MVVGCGALGGVIALYLVPPVHVAGGQHGEQEDLAGQVHAAARAGLKKQPGRQFLYPDFHQHQA